MAARCNYRRETEVSYHSNQNPSFSSTLLDAIYRSIDQGEQEGVIFREAMRTKQMYCSADVVFSSNEDTANFQRASMIEKWMEKKASEKTIPRRQSAADLQGKKLRKEPESSSWSSSDSSSGGGFFSSSSEAEAFRVQRLKPVRTAIDFSKNHRNSEFNSQSRNYGSEFEQNPKSEGGFSKTKSRARRIYSELKKVKQPISPGGRLAGILHNLFAAGKHKDAINGDGYLKSGNISTCSSASSFSRSCLSKTPSSRGKPSTIRSVRFSPESVIYNEDHPQNPPQREIAAKHHPNHDSPNTIRNIIQSELLIHVMEKIRHVESAAMDLNRYHHRDHFGYESEFSFVNLRKSSTLANPAPINDDLDCDDDDDASSYASSDLFELDHLSSIGMERYSEELPVYETTHLRTNRAK